MKEGHPDEENQGENPQDGRSRPAPRSLPGGDRIVAALEAGTPPWREPWDPDKSDGPAMPCNAAIGQRYRGINVLTLGMSAMTFTSGDPCWATEKQAEDHGWQVRKGSRSTTGYFFKRLEPLEDARGSARSTCVQATESWTLTVALGEPIGGTGAARGASLGTDFQFHQSLGGNADS